METTELQKHVDQVIAEMTGIVIDTDEANEQAAEFLRKNKETQKIVQQHFEPQKRAAYEPYKAILDEIKRYTDALTRAEKVVKQKMAQYYQQRERERREEEARRRAEEEARLLEQAEKTGDETVLDTTPMPVPESEPEKPEGISYVDHWTFKVVDLDKLPREYMMPDEKKIRQVVQALKGDTDIPGVQVYNEQTVRVR